MKKTFRVFLHINLWLAFFYYAQAAAQNNVSANQLKAQLSALKNVDQLTKQWLELDKSTQQLMHNWQQEKQQLSLRISLLSHQNDNLRNKINSATADTDQVQQARDNILIEQTKVEQRVASFEQALPNIIDQLQQLMLRLPPEMAQSLSDELHKASSQTQLTSQYQTVANLVKKVTMNQKLIRIKQGVIKFEEQELLTLQLYLGYDQAWFVTQDNSRAGIGYRKNRQWHWQEEAQYASNIRQAINYAQNQMPGPLLNLPIYMDTHQ